MTSVWIEVEDKGLSEWPDFLKSQVPVITLLTYIHINTWLISSNRVVGQIATQRIILLLLFSYCLSVLLWYVFQTHDGSYDFMCQLIVQNAERFCFLIRTPCRQLFLMFVGWHEVKFCYTFSFPPLPLWLCSLTFNLFLHDHDKLLLHHSPMSRHVSSLVC